MVRWSWLIIFVENPDLDISRKAEQQDLKMLLSNPELGKNPYKKITCITVVSLGYLIARRQRAEKK